jgi:alanyl-tRNA synthetase
MNREYSLLKQKNVDTGMGVERTIAVLQGKDNVYETEIFIPLLDRVKELASIVQVAEEQVKGIRVLADHSRAATFLLAEGMVPRNVEQGYVLRRLIRGAIRHGKQLGIEEEFLSGLSEIVIESYSSDYPHLQSNRDFIVSELSKEYNRFNRSLSRGLRRFKRISENKNIIDGKDAFLLYQSFGFPIEITKELGLENNIPVDEAGFQVEFQKHQDVSRASAGKMFGSGLADTSVQTVRLHTATHLLNEALRRVLKKDIVQMGSNITGRRLRFDFNFDRKLTDEELKDVEMLVNEQIERAIPVKRIETNLDEAKKMGTQAVFEDKYGDKVSVYIIGDFSFEICSGPHVENTGELGSFRIVKEEGISAGVRRIRAVLE